MTADVIQLRKPANSDALDDPTRERWLEGARRCAACGHRWEQVTGPHPVGASHPLTVECPACGADKGLAISFVWPNPDAAFFECPGCRGNLFVIQPHRVMCIECGASVRPYDGPEGEPA